MVNFIVLSIHIDDFPLNGHPPSVRLLSLTCVTIFRRYNMSETGVDWKTVPENSTTTVCCTPTAAHNIAPMYFNVSDS